MRRKLVFLDSETHSPEILEFERKLRDKIVGQNEAVSEAVNRIQTASAGLAVPGRPLANLLFLGPTGSGKTRIVEVLAEIFFGNPRAFIKVDCAEFQHSHEIARLVGSPPGYIGHRETPPYLTQEVIDQHQTEEVRITLLLFDEIEKANDALWQLLLGILDKATLTLGDNRGVDLSRCMIFMTSNLGAREMAEILRGGIGFVSGVRQGETDPDVFNQKLSHVAMEAAKHKFSPEFMNRLDRVVVFRMLEPEQLYKILEIELEEVQRRISTRFSEFPFRFRYTDSAKEFLVSEGTSLEYGARHLKRAIEQHLVQPLSNLLSRHQIKRGDEEVVVDHCKDKLVFAAEREAAGHAAMAAAAARGGKANKVSQAGAILTLPQGASPKEPGRCLFCKVKLSEGCLISFSDGEAEHFCDQDCKARFEAQNSYHPY